MTAFLYAEGDKLLQNLKFSSCVNLTKARMQNKKDNEFANVVNSMMLSTNVTKDETT